MTACPCAQELVAGRARERLSEDGFSDDEIERILDRVPVATHNQRGLATLQIGCIEDCVEEIEAAALLAIAEGSMSSEIYELMKRSDEVEVVEKAHRRPRFVEDCVREMVAGVVEAFPQLDGRSFVSARQENLETIHQHNVVAERHGTLGELRAELRLGHAAPQQTSLEQWLDAGRAPEPALGCCGAAPAPAPSGGAGRRSSRGRRARSQRPQVEQRRDPQRFAVDAMTARIAAICRHVLTLPNMSRPSRRRPGSRPCAAPLRRARA